MIYDRITHLKWSPFFGLRRRCPYCIVSGDTLTEGFFLKGPLDFNISILTGFSVFVIS